MDEQKPISGTIIGYDPGGRNAHGVAAARFANCDLQDFRIETLNTAEQVLNFAERYPDLIAIGIDTLTCWSTGESGWRPADRWLRSRYRDAIHSIASPNSLYGSMGINGMSVLLTLRNRNPDLIVTETHPKVLFHALTGRKYDFSAQQPQMDLLLSECLGTAIASNNDHEWDALASLYATYAGLSRQWLCDLHQLAPSASERLIQPCGATHFWWPISGDQMVIEHFPY